MKYVYIEIIEKSLLGVKDLHYKNNRPILDETKLSLDEWLELLKIPEKERKNRFVDYQFPTDSHLKEYLSTISNKSDNEIKDLLRYFLIQSGSLGSDSTLIKFWIETDRILEFIENMEFARRLVNLDKQPWEGVTWILDLLPHWPKMAIDVLNAYIYAHAQLLPDGRYQGLLDSEAIIKARYLDIVYPKDKLVSLKPREFEILISALYRSMNFKIQITPPVKNGGYDIQATKESDSGVERILIECKRYTKKVGIQTVRQLVGILDQKHATRGVIVSTSSFTKPSINFAKKIGRVELVDSIKLNKMLNKYLDTLWYYRLTKHIFEEEKNINI